MPHQMLKFRIDNYVFDLRRQAHSEGRRYGWLDWSFMRWEWVSGVLLLIGGVLLIIGSVLFLPELGPQANAAGSFVFVGSSLCYMITSTHDFLEIVAAALWSHTSKAAASATNESSSNMSGINWMEWYAAITFLCGASLFMVGTASGLLAPMMMDSMDPFLPTAWSFIIGSCCCLTGSMVNSMQIWDAPDRKSAAYANMIAITYIIGSSFYLCGSLPYLYFWNHDEDRTNVMRFVAICFIIGSVLFLMGAIINMYRVQWNEKFDPETNWLALQKKPKRSSSDLEDPLFIKEGKKKERRPSTSTNMTASETTHTLTIHRGNADDDIEPEVVKRSSSLDYSRRRRISNHKHDMVAAVAQASRSSGLWT